ncbi:MAG: D-cysteine desulfhydrase family protein [Anaerolineae bacterium]|nr:D-cysteine desulfhydrase family protein [Anaerolineae bacterium]
MVTDDLPRVTIAHLPTPIEPLPRLTAQLGGPELWVKRDDQTGLATGGNKTRKLEFLVADALAHSADTLVTCGAAQSNHARQTAAAAAKFGLDRVLVLGGHASSEAQGNLLLDRLLDAQIVWTGDRLPQERMSSVAHQLTEDGHHPYVIPYGGSNSIGVSGYVAAMGELMTQGEKQGRAFDHIVLATSSGGTQAGLVVGAHVFGYHGHILGISVDPRAADLRRKLSDLATSTSVHLSLDLVFESDDFDVNDNYLGGGYGVVGSLEREAIRTVARAEGLILDPVYTGRAFGGLLHLIRDGAFDADEKVLFWHTGGTGGLFGHADQL